MFAYEITYTNSIISAIYLNGVEGMAPCVEVVIS